MEIPFDGGTTLVPSTTADTKIQRQYAREQGKKYQLQTSAFEKNPSAETVIFDDMKYESSEQSDDDDEDDATTDSEFPVVETVDEETQISVPDLVEQLNFFLKTSKIQSDYINKLEGDLETAHAEIDALEVELEAKKRLLNEQKEKLVKALSELEDNNKKTKAKLETCLQRQRELQQAQNVLEKEKTECAAELKKHASQLRGTRSDDVFEEDKEGEGKDVHDADEETLEHSAKTGKLSRDWGCVLKNKINNGRKGCRKISGTTNIDKGCTTIERGGKEQCALLKKK